MEGPMAPLVSNQDGSGLDDSLSYSPLRERVDPENSMNRFLRSIQKTRNSPATARLFALLNSEGPIHFPRDLSSPPHEQSASAIVTPGIQGDSMECESLRVAELTAQVATLRSSLETVQKDCEFHRMRASDALDEADRLQKRLISLEDEKQKSMQALESDDLPYSLETLKSTIALNKSLSRQTELLRGRSSVMSRLTKRDIRIQTDVIQRVSVGTDAADIIQTDVIQCVSVGTDAADIISSDPTIVTTSILRKPVRTNDMECQTMSGIWATVEDITPAKAQVPVLPIIRRRTVGGEVRTSTTVALVRQSIYPVSPRSDSRPSPRRTSIATRPPIRDIKIQPLLAPSVDVMRETATARSTARVRSTSERGRVSGRNRVQTHGRRSTSNVSQQRPRWMP